MNYDAGLSIKMKDVLFGDIVDLITIKVNASEISLNNYISTDNMLPNCGGVTHASSLPSADKFNAFSETDTLFSNIRTYFRKVWFAGFSGGASPDVLIFRSRNESFLDPHFLYYLISNKTFIDYTDLTSKGAKMPRGDKDAIAKFPVKLPQINEQKAIASLLGALDDKIQNNHQINETLEEMARSIFKSWFVDFDPVHAKATGNAPAHMDLKTAALFPSSFGGDGLPVGWQKVYLKDLTNIVYGKNLPTKKLLTSGYPVFGGNGVIGFFSEYLYDKPQVLVACRGAASGKVLRSLPFSFVTNNSLVIEITAPHLNRFFLELYLRDLTLEGFTTGSAQPQMTIANMDAVKLLNPTKEVLHRFQMVVEPLFDKVLANDTENQTLAELRDTLLPKLMSGEIRLKDAELEVEAAL